LRYFAGSATIGGRSVSSRPGIFINYRHEDATAHAGRLYDGLSAEFGDDRVFLDDEIPPASDFVEWIENSIGSAGVLIAVIGRNWLTAPDAEGRRRLDNPKDFVRREIVGALERPIRVLPVLVQGASMPSEEDLPPPLARLATLHALEIRDGPYWKLGVGRLVETLTALLGEPPSKRGGAAFRSRLMAAIAVGVAGAALLAVGLALLAEVYLSPDFKFLPVSPALFTAPAPLGLLLGSLMALLVVGGARTGDLLWIGLLLGFGFEAAATGLSLLGEESGRVRGGGFLWLAGGLALTASGAVAATAVRGRLGSARASARETPGWTVPFLAVLGAALLVVGALIPFNVASPGGARVVADDSWLAVDPIATAIAVLGTIMLLYVGNRRLAGGILIALGVGTALFWVRYAGIPVAQWAREMDGVASPRLGGFVGLAGGLIILAAGWRAVTLGSADSRRRHQGTPAPTLSGS
jgi:TIR domain